MLVDIFDSIKKKIGLLILDSISFLLLLESFISFCVLYSLLFIKHSVVLVLAVVHSVHFQLRVHNQQNLIYQNLVGPALMLLYREYLWVFSRYPGATF